MKRKCVVRRERRKLRQNISRRGKSNWSKKGHGGVGEIGTYQKSYIQKKKEPLITSSDTELIKDEILISPKVQLIKVR